MNRCQFNIIRGCLQSSGYGPSRQGAIRLHVSLATIPRHLGGILDHILHSRQRLYRVLQMGRFEVPHLMYATVCWAVSVSQFLLTWVSRHQHPDLHHPLSRLQDYLQDPDPQAKGRRPCV